MLLAVFGREHTLVSAALPTKKEKNNPLTLALKKNNSILWSWKLKPILKKTG